jgi:hypothetical protein
MNSDLNTVAGFKDKMAVPVEGVEHPVATAVSAAAMTTRIVQLTFLPPVSGR